MDIEKLCHGIANQLWKNEAKKLSSVYDQIDIRLKNNEPIEQIKKFEREQLINLSVQITIEAQKLFISEMNKHGVEFVNTKWKKISETVSMVTYTYIDWDIEPDAEKNNLEKIIGNIKDRILIKKTSQLTNQIEEKKNMNVKQLKKWINNFLDAELKCISG